MSTPVDSRSSALCCQVVVGLVPVLLQRLQSLFPQSDLICFAGPRMAKKRLNALMQLDVSRESMISMCTARELMQQKSIAHLLLWACPPCVRLETICHGPNTSSPT